MSLETLLIFTCLSVNSTTIYNQSKDNACFKAAEGYYIYEKLDEQVKEIERHLPHSLVFTATILSGVNQRKVSFPVGYGANFGLESVGDPTARIVFGYEHGF